MVEEITDSPRSLVEEVDGSAGDGSSLETEKVVFSQSAPEFHNSKLSQQYQMSQKGHSNNQNAATSASSSIQNSTAGTSNRTAERVINGHSGVEKPVQNFQKGGSLDRNSATVRDMTTCSKETGLPLSGSATAERGGKQSADDGGSVCSSFNSSDSNYEVLEKQIQTQVC